MRPGATTTRALGILEPKHTPQPGMSLQWDTTEAAPLDSTPSLQLENTLYVMKTSAAKNKQISKINF